MPDTLRCSTDGRVAHVILDRPDRLNAVNGELAADLLSTFHDLDADATVDVVRLSGRGESFSSGYDLGELRDDVGGMAYDNFVRHMDAKRALQDLSRLFRDTPMVIVSAATGHTLGAGLELAVIADICIAAEGATFGFPETGVGLSITNGITNRLPRAVGLHRAKLLALTGERISGREAADMGLVADAVPAARLDDRIDEVIDRLLERAPTAVAESKRLLNAGTEIPYEESLEREVNAGLHLLRTEEYERAIREFFED